MRILDVIPITKGIGAETLSYFSAKDTPIGSIVTIPVRKKGISGVVVASHDIKAIKADIKEADFQLRNILANHKGTLFLPEFVQTCVLLKNYTAGTTGSILSALVPKMFLEEYLESVKLKDIPEARKSMLMPEKFIFQGSWDERITHYKTLVRQEFASKQSVFILCPTIADIDRVSGELEKGISDHVIVLHSSLTKKKLRENYEKLLKHSHPVVVVGTAGFLFVPRTDIETIIVEKEGSSNYKRFTRPYFDERDVAYVLAHTRGLKYIAADQLLRIETLWRAKDEHYGELKPLSFHVKAKAPVVVPMKKKEAPKKKKTSQKEPEKIQPFEVFSKELTGIIKNAITKQKHIVLFAGRKGLAPVTACQDCGSVLRSPDSGLPLVLYHKKDKNGKKKAVYQDPRTQKMFEAIDACPGCSGWRLKLLGIGVETIENELEKQFPKANITLVDGVHTRTHASTQKAVDAFLKKKSGVLVATEKVLPYLTQKVDHVAIVSIDNLFSIPSFTVQEKIMRLLLALQESSKAPLLIQTRDPEQAVIRELAKGNIIDFYRNELRDRKQFGYPPFSLLLDISIGATASTLNLKKTKFEKLFEAFDPIIVVQPGKKTGQMLVHAIMKISESEWIKKTSSKNPGKTFRDIFPILENLPQSYAVTINPERI